jgi:hypothetical protein
MLNFKENGRLSNKFTKSERSGRRLSRHFTPNARPATRIEAFTPRGDMAFNLNL